MLGWECPRCGSCYGPQVYRCEVCLPKVTTTTDTNPVCASCLKNPCDKSLTGCGFAAVLWR